MSSDITIAINGVSKTWNDITENLGPYLSAKSFGAKCDVISLFDVSVTAGTNPVLFCPSANFKTSDIGKICILPKGGTTTSNGILGIAVTIGSVISPTQITLNGIVNTTINNGTARYGSDDTVALNTAIQAQKIIYLDGHTLVTDKLNFAGLSGAFLKGRNGIYDPQTNHYSNIEKYLSSFNDVIHYAGTSPNIPIALFCDGTKDGELRFSTNCGIEGILLDCSGITRSGVGFRGASALNFKNTYVLRNAPVWTGNYIYSVFDGGWDIGVSDNTNFQTVDSSQHQFENWGTIGRGFGITNAKALWLWGDKTKGNPCESNSWGARFISDESSLYPYCEAQQSDSWNFFGGQTQGYFDLHANDSPTKNRSSNNFIVQAGTSQCRSFNFFGYGHYLRLYSSSSNAGDRAFASTNHSYTGFSMENIDNYILHIGKDSSCSVTTQGSKGGGGLGGLVYGFAAPSCKLYRTNNQQIPNNTLTAIAWEVSQNDPLGCWGNSNPTRIIVPKGIFHADLNFSICFDITASGKRYIELYKNGSLYTTAKYIPTNQGGEFTIGEMTRLALPCVGGDYFEVMVLQNCGTSLDVIHNDMGTQMTARFY